MSRCLKGVHAACVSLTLVMAIGACARAEDEAVRELVQQWCASRSLCDCGTAQVSASCEFDYEFLFSVRQAEARELGLEFNAACIDKIELAFTELGCDSPALVLGRPYYLPRKCEDFCTVYRGDKAEGATCTMLDFLGSDCATGLTCYARPGQKTRCWDACAYLPSAGEPCTEPSGKERCMPGLVCDPDQRCIAEPELGDTCFGSCADGFACSWDDLCVDAPKEGESCTSRDWACALGYQCDNGVCVPSEPLVCWVLPG